MTMLRTFKRFLHEDDGFVVAADWVLVASILVLGMAIGVLAARAASADFDDVTVMDIKQQAAGSP
jgi:hypothetical protein